MGHGGWALPFLCWRLLGSSSSCPRPGRRAMAYEFPAYFDAKKNVAIEKWAKYKEDFHLRGQSGPKYVRNSLLWGIAVPIIAYSVLKREQVRNDQRNGRDKTSYF